ncbi:MAG TPA: metallopeptidase (SprT family), partial [Thiotrichales bacterium]|nr:metallopeptidase (SprT family) [Thiotrichales bacterium]
MTVDPINPQQQAIVVEKTRRYIQQAGEIYGKKFQPIDVRFDLCGRNAGMYRVQGRQRWIRYNPYIFSRYFDDNLNTTVPHEVAHYITDCLYGLRKIRPHGIEW